MRCEFGSERSADSRLSFRPSILTTTIPTCKFKDSSMWIMSHASVPR